MLGKRKIHLVVGLVVVFMLGVIGFASANVYNSTKSNSIKNLDNIMVKKTEVRLNAAYSDIKATFNLDKTLKNYNLVDFQGGTDNLDSDILQRFEALDQSPIGSTIPQFYLKNDSSAVMVLYKEGDGTNVVRYAQKVKNEWVEGEMRLPGASIIDIDTIKVE